MQRGLRYYRGGAGRRGSIPILDRGHPLTDRLHCFITPGASGSFGNPDMVSQVQHPFATTNAGYSFVNTSIGRGLKVTNANSVQTVAGECITRTSDLAGGNGSFTIAFLAKFNSIVGVGINIIGQSVNGVSPDCGFVWAANGTVRIFTQGTNIDAASATIAANEIHALVAARDAANNVTVYQDGAVIATGSSVVAIASSTSQTYIGEYGGGAGGASDVTHLAIAGWDRALSAAEVLQWSLDPYCFLIYPEDEMFATLVGAVGAAANIPYNPWPQAAPILAT